jgi:TonB family protein
MTRASAGSIGAWTGLLTAMLLVPTFATEPGETPKRVIAPRSSAATPLEQPVYPKESRRHGHDGIVSLLVLVDVDGTVKDQRVLVSTGYAELDAAALEVTKSWRLQPGTVNGVVTKMWGQFAMTFSVDNKPKPMFTEQHREASKRMEEFWAQMEAAAERDAAQSTPAPPNQ